jgi:hypothetical protein
MSPVDKTNVTDKREDISRFVIHLTRDHGDKALAEILEENTYRSARSNLISILKGRKVEARNAHCLHGKKLNGVPQDIQNQFKVVCFTEIPLHQIHQVIGHIEGRDIEFQPYGLVFRKRFLIEKGAQPAIYINSYQGNMFHRVGADALFARASADNFNDFSWRLLPLLNAMHEKYDFTWEREWRVCGDFAFDVSDIVCLILPAEGDEDLKRVAAGAGVAAISPGWTYEQIVAEMARQQRATREKFEEELTKLKTAKQQPVSGEESAA